MLVCVTSGFVMAQDVGQENEEVVEENTLEAENITLLFNDREVELDFEKRPELLMKAPLYSWNIKGQNFRLSFKATPLMANSFLDIETEFEITINPEELKLFLEEEGVLINMGEISAKVTIEESEETGEEMPVFEGLPKAGYDVRFSRLIKLINHAIAYEQTYIRVPAERVFSPVKIDKVFQKKGIKEVIAIGESNFDGSSKFRKQNIRAGIKKFNGLILPKGEQFSFNTILESVRVEDGFVPELVIKGDRTYAEPGGGLCQVSTTVFRAAFAGGFPIDSRRSHSYAVGYYTPYGLDATIYLGGQDFQFTNDTDGDILIQAEMDKEHDNLYFVFYGTDPEKTVKMEGPFISHWKKAPPDQVIETSVIPAGSRRVVSDPHPGFRAEWTRSVLHKGEIETNALVSNYRPWPKQTLIGVAEVARAE